MSQRRQAQDFEQEGAREQSLGRYIPASTCFIAAGSVFKRLHCRDDAERCFRQGAAALDRAADEEAREDARRENRRERTQ